MIIDKKIAYLLYVILVPVYSSLLSIILVFNFLEEMPLILIFTPLLASTLIGLAFFWFLYEVCKVRTFQTFFVIEALLLISPFVLINPHFSPSADPLGFGYGIVSFMQFALPIIIMMTVTFPHFSMFRHLRKLERI